jgi:hypothetical protein
MVRLRPVAARFASARNFGNPFDLFDNPWSLPIFLEDKKSAGMTCQRRQTYFAADETLILLISLSPFLAMKVCQTGLLPGHRHDGQARKCRKKQPRASPRCIA